MEMSRRCVPYTPLFKPLEKMKFSLISVAGLHLKSQEAYNKEADETYRLIPADVKVEDLMFTHEHYDHTDADKDPNLMFPIDRLRELAEAGIIGGVASKHFGMGYSMKLKEVYANTIPAIAKEIERSNADGVILTAG